MPIRTGGVTSTNLTGVVEDELGVEGSHLGGVVFGVKGGISAEETRKIWGSGKAIEGVSNTEKLVERLQGR